MYSKRILLNSLSLPSMQQIAKRLQDVPRHANEQHLLANLPDCAEDLSVINDAAKSALLHYDEESDDPFFIIAQITYIYSRYKLSMIHGFDSDDYFLLQCIEHHPVIFDDYFEAVKRLKTVPTPLVDDGLSFDDIINEISCEFISQRTSVIDPVVTMSNEKSVTEPPSTSVSRDNPPPHISVSRADSPPQLVSVSQENPPLQDDYKLERNTEVKAIIIPISSDESLHNEDDPGMKCQDPTLPSVVGKSRKRKLQRKRARQKRALMADVKYAEYSNSALIIDDRLTINLKHAPPDVEILSEFFKWFRVHDPKGWQKYNSSSRERHKLAIKSGWC